MTQNKRGITAEDLYKMRVISDPQLSPDGRRVAYVQTVINEQREYRSQLFWHSLGENKELAVTSGSARDTFPRWSPDGKRLCFVSTRSGRPQIWLIDAEGGEPKQLTRCKSGAGNPVWSPDGKRILFSATIAPGESFAEEESEQQPAPVPKALVVTRMKYKSDEHGFLYEKNKQLAIIDVDSGTITPVSEGPYDHTAGSWSPDGNWLAVTANRSENPDRQHVMDVYLVPVHGGEWINLTGGKGIFALPTWSPDGKRLAYIGSETNEHVYATVKKMWVTDLEKGEHVCVTADWDVQIGDVTIGDLRSPGHPNPGGVWTLDGQGLYFLASERGNSGIYHTTLDGRVTQVIGGNRNIYGFSLDDAKKTGIIAASDPTLPGDLFQVNLMTGNEQRLTNVNDTWRKEVELSQPEELTWEAPDGWKLQGWLLKPVDWRPGEKIPLVLQIHGGPHSMYGNTYFHEFQLLAANGYAVLYTNPRGSHGYGETFAQACCGDYGGADYRDLMSAVDFALDRYDFLDESRMGVAGGSYGGFMTNWIVGQTNRFHAAVTDRSISNWQSFYGVSDIGYYFSAEEIQANPFDNPEKLWQHSPIRFVDRINTPLLIMHGEQDHRCPIEQAEQLFIALRHQDKAPVSFIRFPGASHEMSRSGDPEQRVLRLRYTLDWFETHLRMKKGAVVQ